jgi:hypothetical protein
VDSQRNNMILYLWMYVLVGSPLYRVTYSSGTVLSCAYCSIHSLINRNPEMNQVTAATLKRTNLPQCHSDYPRFALAAVSGLEAHLLHQGEDDPIVEYEDEFGRIRSARKSEVPRNLVKHDYDLPTERDVECVFHSHSNAWLSSTFAPHNLSQQPTCNMYV